MKKVLIVLLLITMPVIAKAECDEKKHAEYVTYASNITYDNNFSQSTKKYTITINNLIEDVHVVYNNKKYLPTSDNSVVISDISQGTDVKILVYANDGCEYYIKNIYVSEPYYNTFYGSTICKEYADKLTYCSSKFTKNEVTQELVEMAIQNYNHNIVQDAKKEEEKPTVEVSVKDKIVGFLLNWGIKIALSVLTCITSIVYFNNKFMKIKHGI